jgi:hypothetical protein
MNALFGRLAMMMGILLWLFDPTDRAAFPLRDLAETTHIFSDGYSCVKRSFKGTTTASRLARPAGVAACS